MKKFLSFLTITCTALSLLAASNTQDDVTSNYRRSGSNHYAYPIPGDMPAPALTEAPAGYEAFYIDHYGRHGSRWLTTNNTYDRTVATLEKAENAHCLTALGEETLHNMRIIAEAARMRAGDLSDVGAEQHQGIARRMLENFPSVWGDDAVVDARSTVVFRCILSMQNETMTLRAAYPNMRITTDASYHDMSYMGWGHGEDTIAIPIRHEMSKISDSLYRADIDTHRFIHSLVSDTAFAAHEINGLRLMRDVFNIAGSLQGHHQFDGMNLFYLFTNDEIFDLWRIRNVYWYTHWANAPQNGHRMPYIERPLLRNIIESADRAIAEGRKGADLRFGHETCVLPLACLMELDNVNESISDLDNLHNVWQDYNFIPKACNIQMIFYRPVSGQGDILVKVLYNEHEAALPVATVSGPYCRWDDLKAHYLKRIEHSPLVGD